MIKTFQSNKINRAKPLIYLAMLLSSWVLARIIFILSTTIANDADMRTINSPLDVAVQTSHESRQFKNSKIHITREEQSSASAGLASQLIDISAAKVISSGTPYLVSASNNLPESYYPFLFLGSIKERSASLVRPNNYVNIGWDLPPGNKIIAPEQSNQNDRFEDSNLATRLRGYAYIFARTNSGIADALGGRYGGSQAAIQLSYLINPNQKIGIDASLRAQSALNDSDRELAVGLSVKPINKLPLTVVAERRFRPSNPDGYALYVAGGKSNISLPANFKLNTYGQAGVSTAGRDTLFFDGQIIAEKSIHKNSSVEILAGGGAWTGGQRGAQRFDIGPSFSIKLSLGKKNYRISGDWRERIGGNASPDSGAAITLSTDF